MLAIIRFCVFVHLLPAVLLRDNPENSTLYTRSKTRELSRSSEENVPPSHPCKIRTPCRNFGICKPAKNSEGKYTNDYTCECFKEYFQRKGQNQKVCDLETNHCKKNTLCLNNGRCQQTWGSFFCNCTAPWGGRYCEEKFEGQRIGTPVFIFDPEGFTGHPHRFVLYLLPTKPENLLTGTDLTMEIKFDEHHTFSSKLVWQQVSTLSHLRSFSSPNVNARLKIGGPRRFIEFSHMLECRNEFCHVHLALKNRKVTQFENTYKVWMRSNPSECLPDVILQDCSTSNDKPILFRRRDIHIIRGRALQGCPEISTLKHKWIFYDVSNANIPFDGKNEIKYNQPSNTFFEFVIKPFTLKQGKYALRLQVQEIVGEKIKLKKSGTNTATCWFNVAPEPLVAVIDGGLERTADPKVALVMDASASLDPNEDRSHQKIGYSWSCETNPDDVSPNFCKGINKPVSREKVWKIPPASLKSINSISFRLEVKSPQESSRPPAQATQKLNILHGENPYIKIRCLKNCAKDRRTNIQEEVSFEVICTKNCKNSDRPEFYEWSKTVGPGYITWISKTETPRNSPMLILKPNALQGGAEYGFSVTAGGLFSKSKTSIEIFTNKGPSKGDCVFGESSVEYITELLVTCSNFKVEEEWPLKYQFFQKNTETDDGYGELIDYGTSNKASLLLSRGSKERNYKTTITIVVTDVHGMYNLSTWEHEVKPVTTALGTDVAVFLNETLFGTSSKKSIPNLLAGGSLTVAANIASILAGVIADASLTSPMKIYMKKKIIHVLEKKPLNTFSAVYQVSSVLQKITRDKEAFDYSMARIAVNLTAKLSRSLRDKSINTKETSMHDLRKVVENIVQILSTVMTVIEEMYPPPPEKEIQDEIYDEYAYDYSIFSQEAPARFKEMFFLTKDLINIIQEVGDSLMDRIVKSQKEIKVDSAVFALRIKIDLPEKLVDSPLGGDSGYAIITKELAKSLGSFPLGVQIATFQINPFWWHPTSKKINSHSLSLIFKNTETQKEIKNLPKPLDIFLEIKNSQVEEIIAKINITQDDHGSLNHENNLLLYRFILEKGQSIIVNFSSPLNPKLKIILAQNELPSVEDFSKKGVIVPESNKNGVKVVTTRETAEDNHAWFFVAILPLEKPPSGVSEMTIYFETSTTLCQYWNNEEQTWVQKDCYVGSGTTKSQINCHCKHATFFSGSMTLSPYKLITDEIIPIIQPLYNNLNMLIFILELLMILLFLMIWAYFTDKKDKSKSNVVLLADNSSNAKYAYLITVYTGFKRNAGTSSTVGIKLMGSKEVSEPHLLVSKYKANFTTGATDWFVIFTVRSLGELQKLHLWHNNRGHRPPWYLNAVVVRDIQTKQKWVFLANRWLSLVKKGNYIAQCFLEPSTEQQLMSKKTMFLENISHNLKEDHIWLSVFTRNPRSFFTRCERVAVIICSMHCAMLFCTAFFEIPREKSDDQLIINLDVDLTRNIKILIFGFISAFVTLPLNCFLIFLFRKSEVNNVNKMESIQRKVNNESHCIYSDIENEKKFNTFQSIIFYSLPIDPLNQTHDSIETTCFSRPTDISDLKPKPEEGEFYHPFILPFWTKYIAWAICAALILLSSSLIIVCGLSFGSENSYYWIFTALAIMFFSIVFIEPLKVIVITLIFTFYLKVHPYDMDFLRGHLLLPIIEKPHTEQEIKNLHRKQEYHPLSSKVIPIIREKEKTRIHYQGMAIDLLIFIIYAIIIYVLAKMNRNSFGYMSSKSAHDMFIDAQYYGIPLHLVRNEETLRSYLNDTLLPTIHEIHILDESPNKRSSWTADLNSQLLGVVRLRQHRIKPGHECELKARITDHLVCIPEYKEHTADKSDYEVGWSNDGNTAYPQKAQKAFVFTNSSRSGSYPTFGEFAYYHGGGYVAELGRTLNNSRLVLDFILDNDWLNYLTRFIAVEFTIYNANVRLFNVISIIVEISPSGYYYTSYTIRTSQLTYKLDSTQIGLLLVFILFVIITCLFIYQQITAIQRLSFKEHFSELWNIADVVICVIAFLCVIVFALRNDYVSSLMLDLENSAHNTFVSFFGACAVDYLLTCLIALLVCAITFRFWKILRYLRYFQIFEQTLMRGGGPVIGVVIMLLIFIGAFSGFVYLAMGDNVKGFYSPFASFITLISMTIGYNSDITYEVLSDVHRILGPSFYLLFSTVTVIYLLNMFITVIMEYYSIAKETKDEKNISYSYNLNDYLRDEFNYHFKKKHGPEKWEADDRLRGGADEVHKIHSKLLLQKFRKALTAQSLDGNNSNVDKFSSTLLQKIGNLKTRNTTLDPYFNNHFDKKQTTDAKQRKRSSHGPIPSLGKTTKHSQKRKDGIESLKSMLRDGVGQRP